MRSIRYSLAFLAAAVAACVVQPAAAQQTADFDGTWEGMIHIDKGDFINIPNPAPQEAKYRIAIHGPVVDVSVEMNGVMMQPPAGVFHIAQVNTNAIIFASNAHGGAEGGWTESWSILATPKDENTLIVVFSRLVNNSGFTDDKQNTKFGAHGTGEFTRVGP